MIVDGDAMSDEMCGCAGVIFVVLFYFSWKGILQITT